MTTVYTMSCVSVHIPVATDQRSPVDCVLMITLTTSYQPIGTCTSNNKYYIVYLQIMHLSSSNSFKTGYLSENPNRIYLTEFWKT